MHFRQSWLKMKVLFDQEAVFTDCLFACNITITSVFNSSCFAGHLRKLKIFVDFLRSAFIFVCVVVRATACKIFWCRFVCLQGTRMPFESLPEQCILCVLSLLLHFSSFAPNSDLQSREWWYKSQLTLLQKAYWKPCVKGRLISLDSRSQATT